jgi:hypothetical protein
MTETRKITSQNEMIAMEFENFLDFVDKLSDEQKGVLTQKLTVQNSVLTVVLGGYNVINNSLALQLNGNSEALEEQLKNLPFDVVLSLVEAIALWIGKNKSPSS